MVSSYIFINDIRLHYLHWNLEDDGQPVVLLHGLASNARIWEKVAPLLARRGLVLFAPDLRGHGLTDGPDGDYNFPTYLRDLTACLDACSLERPVLVGHSWGAMLALDYAAHFPVGPRSPLGIVLIDGGMNQLNAEPGATWESIRDRLTPPRLAGMPLNDFLHRARSSQHGWTPDEESLSIILANFEILEEAAEDGDSQEKPGSIPGAEEGETGHIYPHLSFEHHMQIVRAMWEFPTYERFSRVNCPVLMLPTRPAAPLSPGEEEWIAAKEWGLQQAQARIRSLEVHWMPETVHDAPLQRPAEVVDLISRFIEEKLSQG